jgi:hypothetical protein
MPTKTAAFRVIATILGMFGLGLGAPTISRGWQFDNGDGTFINPPLYADYPDPDVIRVGEDFYFITSSFANVPGLRILHSKDLVNWEIISHVIPRLEGVRAYDLDGGVSYRNGVFAPSLRYHKGTFYVAVTPNGHGQNTFIYSARDVRGPWTAHELDRAAFDPGLFIDDHGKGHIMTSGGWDGTATLLTLNEDFTKVATPSLRLQTDIVSESAEPGSFPLVRNKQAAPLLLDSADDAGVLRAASDLQADIERVAGIKPALATNGAPAGDVAVIVGALGKSPVIDGLAKSGKLKADTISGKWESFIITTVANPLPGINQALVIAGSDKRGTIYGIYEISGQIGVSPWYWWADVPPQRHENLFIKAGTYVQGPPAVKYRGIFINDEEPCFGSWARQKFGGINSKMYSHMFELLLRLRANYLWPAMWGKAFNENDPENPRLANEYGIVMGTSHHEPMMRAQAEWGAHRTNYGNGQWNYVTNEEGLKKFWKDGLERNKNYENIVTMGMRGDGDAPMADAGSAEANFRLLERIMADQRRIVADVTGKPASETPQIWALYSEVLEFYDQGMKVPDDMIIVLCDDNWGNVRRLPELNGKKHPGGYGIYYHVDLHGAPRAYQWLNMTQIPHMWEQLQLTYDYGVDKIWILNVGDLKPMEYPMSFFLTMAWNPKALNSTNLYDYTREFCAQQFGAAHAEEAARILNACCKYNSRVTAEMLDHRTYNLGSGEFEQVKNEYLALEACALRQFATIPDDCKDAYKELVLFPVQAMANLYEMYYAVAMNRKLAAEHDLKANDWADRVEYCFKRDAELCYDYNHNIARGKWNHMMDQVHIGYTSWDEPKGGRNIMPKVQRVSPEEARKGGYVFSEKGGVVVMEAEHYFSATDSAKATWTVIPDLGRTLSGFSLMPDIESVEGAALRYKMKLNTKTDLVKVRIIFDSTLPFKKGAHSVAAGFEGGEEKAWPINDQLTWAHNYRKMYPAGAARINEVETTLKLPAASDGIHTLVLRPLDPGMVFHKVIVDCGGYEQTHLKMPESPYNREP